MTPHIITIHQIGKAGERYDIATDNRGETLRKDSMTGVAPRRALEWLHRWRVP